MACPRCNDQGLIYKARIVNLGIELMICDECEACWLPTQEITRDNFEDLSTFLEKHGTNYNEAKIEKLGHF
ncbi:hypothetical protein K2X40_05525 [Candidatus Babeliales bacterium]|nr:hypothetical protein [Candidatus Babeliales bacterium]